MNRLGFKPIEKKIKWKEVQSGKLIEILLTRIVNTEVEITAENEDMESGVRENVESFSMLPTVSGNLESVLPSIALGLRSSAGGELSSQYSVRGGSYDENLVFVNDFEIFRPQLIRNGQQEGLSFPNPDLVKELKFYSGGFESKYGDKLSSVMDIRYKNPDTLKASAAASLLGMSFHLEGSSNIFGKNTAPRKLSYLVGARYKTTRYILSSLDVKGEYTPDFLDLQGFVNYDLSRQWKLSWIGNINRSHFKLIPESSTVAKGSFFQILNLNTEFEGSEDDYFEQNMTGLSLNFISDQSRYPFFMKWNAALYYGYEAERFDILGYYRLVEVEAGQNDEEGKEVKLWGVGTQHLYARNRLESIVQHYEWRGAIDFSSTSSGIGHFMQWGAWYRREHLDDKINEWERLDSAGYALPLSDSGLRIFNVYKSSNEIVNDKFACWVQDEIKWKINDQNVLKINGGIRLHHSGLNQEFLMNPRLKNGMDSHRQQTQYTCLDFNRTLSPGSILQRDAGY
ncbi:MAG: TonB-dependent receptor plug domain-containing protein [Saprospiraceae bacterium]|nr:TonB-dependent receptor plug domain-containing protein [Saprospiraceae bacterium]